MKKSAEEPKTAPVVKSEPKPSTEVEMKKIAEKIAEIRNRARTMGVKVPITSANADVYLRAVQTLVAEKPIFAIECYEKGKIIRAFIATKKEVAEKVKKKLEEREEDDDTFIVLINRYGLLSEKCSAEKEEHVKPYTKFVEKLGWTDLLQHYCNSWSILDSENDGKHDLEIKKDARKCWSTLLPQLNENGHLILTIDEQGNMILAAPIRCNQKGEYSYGIYRRGADGAISESYNIGADEVASLGTKLSKKIERSAGMFTGRHGVEAMQRLWLWNIVKRFEPKSFDDDDLSMDQIRDLVEGWTLENVGCKFGKENPTEPVFIGKKRDGKIIVGIWADSLADVFELLQIKYPPQKWIQEAKTKNWIEAYNQGYKKQNPDGSEERKVTKRSAYNPSDDARRRYQRKNSSERVYLLDLSEEERQAAWDKKVAINEAQKIQFVKEQEYEKKSNPVSGK
jgi:hypothetical protein